jgi:hypothetical protein
VPAFAPPAHLRATPVLATLPAGSKLWRVHGQSLPDPLFTTEPSDPQFGAGRFDAAPPEDYPFCYAGLSPGTALMERFCRGIRYNDSGVRVIRRSQVRGQQLSTIELIDDLRLVSLQTQQDLAAVQQDSWLIHADAAEYSKTSAWAHWIRKLAPTAAGIIWPSKRDISGRAVVLFGDRCQHLLMYGLNPAIDLTTVGGATFIQTALADYKVTIALPRP